MGDKSIKKLNRFYYKRPYTKVNEVLHNYINGFFEKIELVDICGAMAELNRRLEALENSKIK